MNGPPERQPGVPRLGVGHLLLWTACCAVVLAIDRGQEQNPLEWNPIVENVWRIGYAMVLGVALAAVCLFGWWKIRGQFDWRIEPGHWLLMESGLGGIVNLMFRLAPSLLVPVAAQTATIEVIRPLLVAACLANICDLFVACFILVMQRCERRWWVCLVMIVAQRAVSCLAFIPFISMVFSNSGFSSSSLRWYNLGQSVQMLAAAITVLLVIVAALIDIRRGQRRDWLHWTGVSVRLLMPMLYAIMYVTMRMR